MSDRVIVFVSEAGGVAVCNPSGEIPIELVLEKDVPVGSNAVIVDRNALPWQHNDFFDAWELNNGEVSVSFNKAVDLTKKRLRFERTALLQSLDVQFQRALETGAPTAEIVAEKQRLRDLPALADSCTSLDQLRDLKAAQ